LTSLAVSLGAFYISKNQPSAKTDLKGSILCTASNSGLYPLGLAPIYTTAKYGVVGMVRGLAARFQHEKIQINAIAPCIVGKLNLNRTFHHLHSLTICVI
jgi:NAD(P)-dependent dehydrogenase (short-subunit alcohol dehydrogenase family)